ncbi:hypothetical protein [Alteribacillus iranensis]|uniref:hypothetical protein n=1 Tax=Alteribacillus iranensis TaxID=930128 RepID=UPI0011604767|nr:hypothetical protein [Alteribacillus iranensis]
MIIKWWKWLLLGAFCAIGLGLTIFLTSTPIFSHSYQQLTERVEIGVKYTNPEKQVMYLQPYVQNPNDASDLTLTLDQDFIEIVVLDDSRDTVEGAVQLENINDPSSDMMTTTLGPGEAETAHGYYTVQLSPNARWIQLEFTGDVEDEFGSASIEKLIEVDVQHLHVN